ncbi:MAG: alpha/beta fold hydrolase [Flavobacteriaceae bacterium]|nr:alpha/beta fold hydrolase [Flavobacteriaceae bacterium]
MPIIDTTYKANGIFKDGHFATIYSAKLRPIPKLEQKRERLILPDGDFIDLDRSYSNAPSRKVALLLHGLEGNAQRVYIKGQGKVLVENGWDVVAMNYRGCSGEDNHRYLSYHSGQTDDLEPVIDHILSERHYDEMSLIGFSLGGNLVLKYLGERSTIPTEIRTGVAISVPIDLRGSLEQLSLFKNFVYSTSFIRDLKKKYKRKMERHPEKMSVKDLKKISTLLDFDNIYTAPAHGFDNAFDYYAKSSSLNFLPKIQHKVLILNAKNDTFLSESCYPYELASKSKNLYLETPKHGGHVGFYESNSLYYSERRTVEFINR